MGRLKMPTGKSNKVSNIEDLSFNGWGCSKIESILREEYGEGSFEFYSLNFIKTDGDIHTHRTLRQEDDKFVYPYYDYKITIKSNFTTGDSFKNSEYFDRSFSFDKTFSVLNSLKESIDDNFKDDFYIFISEFEPLNLKHSSSNPTIEVRISLIFRDGVDLDEYMDFSIPEEGKFTKVKKFMDFMQSGRHDTGPR